MMPNPAIWLAISLMASGLMASSARALCLQASGPPDRVSEPIASPDPAIAPWSSSGVRIGNGGVATWPKQPPNLWVDVPAGHHRTWVRILGDGGKVVQSFRVEDPGSSCVSYNSFYATYRVISGRRQGGTCQCW